MFVTNFSKYPFYSEYSTITASVLQTYSYQSLQFEIKILNEYHKRVNIAQN